MKHGWLILFVASCAVTRADDGFEKQVRPAFIEHCASCHGVKKQSAGLRLDTVAGIRLGADDGPVIVAGKPGDSRLIKAIRHVGDTAMPPKKKLPEATIAVIAAWVERGAPMPAEVSQSQKADPKSHWAYQPVKPHPGKSIDDFISAMLKEQGLTFNAPADRRTLLRRVYFDLIGLPPTAAESDAFAKDTSPQAYERVVDHLLASPRYGERWARHWLDVARYADTKGYVFTEDRNYPYAYTYRDYVIQAFNDDKPYDRFIVEQIAADHLDLGEDNRALAALGYLTLGRRFNNDVRDIIDDRIEVVTRGFLGLSVGCARCHDHKFDPIPIGDYYSLYGVFASSMEPKEQPLLTHQKRTPEMDTFDAELAKMDAEAAKYYAKMIQDALAQFRTPTSVAEYLLAWRNLRGASPSTVENLTRKRNLNRPVLANWRKRLDAAKGKPDDVFAAWLALADLPDAEFALRAASLKLTGPADLTDALHDAGPLTIDDAAMIYGEVIASSDTPKLRDVLVSNQSPTTISNKDTENVIPIPIKKQYRVLRNAAQNARATSPYSPPRAMVLVDAPKLTEPVVFLRGNPGNRGPKVPRQFLEVLTGPDRKPFQHGSGRLDLAQAIASKDNPLTARVMVNRVWTWHFGQGLVRTASDFGVRTDPATHPELLDMLASQFMADGWSLKQLHRRIVLSQAYRQSSAITPKALTADPENALLSRSPRKRLEFEPMRDAILTASGTLDVSQVGGRSEEIFKNISSHRRSVYTFIERQNLPGTLRNFDLANPDSHAPMRYRTTVPQQALFLMNSPFVAAMAKKTIRRDDVTSAGSDSERIVRVYRAVLGRDPTKQESKLASDYLRVAPAADGKLGPWEQLAQALMMSNEFVFVD